MKVAGSYSIAIPRAKAYALLQDPVVLAKCMPGVDELKKTGEHQYEMRLKMAIASFSGLFAGKIHIADPHPPEDFKLVVEGNGKIGFLKGEGLLNLSEQNQSTEVRYEGDVQVGGTIASVGQRLLDATSKLMIKRFFDKFNEHAAQIG